MLIQFKPPDMLLEIAYKYIKDYYILIILW